MELKKIRPDWEVALEYYLFGNIISALPLLIFGAVIGRLTNSPTFYFFFQLISGLLIFYFSFLLSSIYITKHYIILRVRRISNFAAAYLIFFNSALLFFYFAKSGTLTIAMLISALLIIGGTVILLVCTPKFIKPSLPDEIESVRASNSGTHDNSVSGLKRIIRTAFLTAAGIIMLVFAPFILYFTIIGESAQWSQLAWPVVIVWEITWIYIFWRFAFRKRRVGNKNI